MIALRVPAVRRWLVPDERGSIIANDNGSTVTINSYDEYGQGGSSNAGRFQYVGMPWIAEAGIYQMGARNYAPGIGRWLQTDPILTAGGINLYAYVGNDPVNALDFLGLSTSDCHTGTLFCNGYIPIGGFSCIGSGCADPSTGSGGSSGGSGSSGSNGGSSGGSNDGNTGSSGFSNASTTRYACTGAADEICVTGIIPRHRSYDDVMPLFRMQLLLDTLHDSNQPGLLVLIQSLNSLDGPQNPNEPTPPPQPTPQQIMTPDPTDPYGRFTGFVGDRACGSGCGFFSERVGPFLHWDFDFLSWWGRDNLYGIGHVMNRGGVVSACPSGISNGVGGCPRG